MGENILSLSLEFSSFKIEELAFRITTILDRDTISQGLFILTLYG
jgi:hypothetical protein